MQRLQRFPRLLDNLHTELSNKDIAEHLFVSPRTVQAHLSHA
jgi:DNA-binding NarL/FixJ family response regulator